MSKLFACLSSFCFIGAILLDTQVSAIDQVFLNRFVLAFYGSLLYHFIQFRFQKDKGEEKNEKDFNWKKYRITQYDDWVFSAFWIPLAGYFGETWFNDLLPNREFEHWYYLLAGASGDFIYLISKNLWKSGFAQMVAEVITLWITSKLKRFIKALKS